MYAEMIYFLLNTWSCLLVDIVAYLHVLFIQPEGETQYYNKAVFVDLRNKQPFKTTVNLDIPQNIVAGSEMVEVSAVGM